MATKASEESLRAEYAQVGDQFRALTEIRFKLLALLPLGTVASVFVSNDTRMISTPLVSLFGFIVVLCLATYDKRNDQLYDELVGRAAELERELGLDHGSFAHRPTSWLRFGPWKITHRTPVATVYASSAAVWGWLFVAATTPDDWITIGGRDITRLWPSIAIAVIAIGWFVVDRWEMSQADALRNAVRDLATVPYGLWDQEIEKRRAVRRLVEDTKRRRRIEHHTANASDDRRARAIALAAVIDLPPRWIEDVWTGRR